MSDSDSEKTQEATPEKRKKARDEGQFPRGKDAGNTMATAFVIMVLLTVGPWMVGQMHRFTRRCFGEFIAVKEIDVMSAMLQGSEIWLIISIPCAFAAVIGGLSIGFLEAGFNPKMELAAPKWDRLNPMSKFGSLFLPQHVLPNLAMQLARVAIVGIVAYHGVKDAFPVLMKLARGSLISAVNVGLSSLLNLVLWSTLVLVVMAATDYGVNLYKHEKKLMMSMQDLKDEMKQQDGDPKTKGRQRQRAREIAKRSLAKQVLESDFIVANPTHISCAIRYRAEEGAPILVAKGYDDVALYMREIAKKADIPIVTNIPVARRLAKDVKEGRHIPADLYAAVAEILAFVYRIKNRSIL